MLTEEECMACLNQFMEDTNYYVGYVICNNHNYEFDVLSKLIKEHFELVDLIEKWGLNNLSIEELDEWHDRVIWYVQKCDELNDELTKVNDYYFRVEKAIQTLFGVSADDILEIEKGKDKGL